MKKTAPLILTMIVFVISFCKVYGQNIPSSPRSREAISRVRPELEKEFLNEDLTFGAPIYLRIFKDEEVLEVWVSNHNGFRLFKTYTICTYGNGSLGPKTRQGDGQAPEGFYYVTPNRLNPVSNFHLSFNLGYPNRYDRIHGRTGSALMVHGSCVSIGCYAMTEENMNRHSESKWHSFWENLKEGYDYFHENGHIPPNVEVLNACYVFETS